MNAISGVIELLLLKRTNSLDINISAKEEIEYLRIAYKSVQQLNTLISDDINYQDVDVVKLVKECVIIKAKSALVMV